MKEACMVRIAVSQSLEGFRHKRVEKGKPKDDCRDDVHIVHVFLGMVLTSIIIHDYESTDSSPISASPLLP
jgi:hypothetical protein